MATIKDTIEIKTTPEKIKEWLRNLDKHYQEWHPDHVKFVKVTGGMDAGDIVYFEQYLQGKLHKFKWKVTKAEIERDKKEVIEFRALGFREWIVSAKASLIIIPKENSCIFTSTFSFRFGWLISKFFKRLIKTIKIHMRQEGENLKSLLERA